MKRTLVTLTLVGLIATPVFAQSSQGPRGQRPTDKIAADLGIQEQEFVACFAEVRPDPGKAPSGARQHANKAVLLPCLQNANAAITNDLLDSVMDRYRPEGPMRN
ncbi:MAG: hypothetical protein JXR13_06530 [Thalassovita sp.]